MIIPVRKTINVFIISDATGVTAERVIKAALLQFKDIKPHYQRHPYIMETEQIDDILHRAEQTEVVVIYSLVSRRLRDYFLQRRKRKRIYAIDLLGPLLKRIERQWNVMPSLEPGLLDPASEASLQLAESIEFTLQHDDGQGIDTLHQADLIILGVSRTSKTPTSLYLSCNSGLKVANLPILLNTEPPEEIFTVKVRKVGFSIAPEKVARIRIQRRIMPGPSDYTDLEVIRKELLFCQKIYRRIPNLKVFDVANRSIEEIADKIAAG